MSEIGIRFEGTKEQDVWVVVARVFAPGVETVDPKMALFSVVARHERREFAEDLARRAALRMWSERTE